MNLAGTINVRQLAVLQWIADGCPHGVMKDYTYQTTAIALQGRRLVTVTRKGGGWQPELTDAGGHYLRHGTYPEGFWTTSRKTPVAADLAIAPPATVADSRRSAAAESADRTWKSAIDPQSQHLVARVIAADGRAVAIGPPTGAEHGQRDGQAGCRRHSGRVTSPRPSRPCRDRSSSAPAPRWAAACCYR